MRLLLDARSATYWPNEPAWPKPDVSVTVRRRADETDGQLLTALAAAVTNWENNQ